MYTCLKCDIDGDDNWADSSGQVDTNHLQIKTDSFWDFAEILELLSGFSYKLPSPDPLRIVCESQRLSIHNIQALVIPSTLNKCWRFFLDWPTLLSMACLNALTIPLHVRSASLRLCAWTTSPPSLATQRLLLLRLPAILRPPHARLPSSLSFGASCVSGRWIWHFQQGGFCDGCAVFIWYKLARMGFICSAKLTATASCGQIGEKQTKVLFFLIC